MYLILTRIDPEENGSKEAGAFRIFIRFVLDLTRFYPGKISNRKLVERAGNLNNQGSCNFPDFCPFYSGSKTGYFSANEKVRENQTIKAAVLFQIFIR